MGRRILLCLALLMGPTVALAQSTNHPPRAQGYGFFGPLISNLQFVPPPGLPLPPGLKLPKRGGATAGFGGEMFVRKGLGVGLDFAWAGPHWTFDKDGLGVGSLDLSYHFFRRGRVEPFVVAGYSLYFGDRRATQNGYNAGGGLNLWVARHVALRFEARDQGNVNHFHSPFTNFVALRFGVTFR
jgi:hypothetical protein